MKLLFPLILLALLSTFARAGDLAVSAKEPIHVTAPDQWTAALDKSPEAAASPFPTYRVTPPANRNAACLISIFDKDKAEFATAPFLKKLLRGDSRPYVANPADLAKLEFKEIKIAGGLGYYANFVDPDLVGKPVKKGTFKTATPIILSIGSQYLIKATILTNDLTGADYRDLIKIVESIKIKKD